jgi:hypothetical protein
MAHFFAAVARFFLFFVKLLSAYASVILVICIVTFFFDRSPFVSPSCAQSRRSAPPH